MERFSGQVGFVTGAASGIGRSIALNLAREGADVVACDVNAAGMRETCSEIEQLGRRALAQLLDVASAEQISSAVDAALGHFGKIDVLMNIAGISPKENFLDCTEESWDITHDVNLKGVMLCSQTVARHMVERKSGKIVSIASTAAEVIFPNLGPFYHTSKAGVSQLTRYMAQELAPHGINVNAIGPGTIVTPLTQPMIDNKEISGPILSRIPLQRFGQPDDIARVALFLASEDAVYVTGQTILVDGGLLLLV